MTWSLSDDGAGRWLLELCNKTTQRHGVWARLVCLDEYLEKIFKIYLLHIKLQKDLIYITTY